MNTKKILKIILISLLVLGILIILGNMIFWSIAMGKLEKYPSTAKEHAFIDSLENKTYLFISYNDLPKKSTIQNIYIYRGYDIPKITINKHNVKKISDSIFSEFMKVYSLKKETDSLFIIFNLDSLKDKKTKIHYHIDTSFHYKVK
ncbi:hypothetical protein [Bergeyella zoohelcum]|uniref:Uncharacterized protein n=1 Tax=Bergeyella zoohelcum TaxID=1015 RepID=A0A7Z8YM20_9FLAO|nr:hypothetical protein [Bergeyella zoohelcum]VDH02634.1 Uncharacterised protein [Bergeyella zoohelcum]